MTDNQLTEADFDELKRQSREKMEAFLDRLCEDQGWDRSEMKVSSCTHTAICYCACPDGPCQHEFEGWRESEDGLVGEQVCSRCGMGAMGHAMRVGP